MRKLAALVGRDARCAVRFVRAVYGKDAQPDVQGDFTVRGEAGSLVCRRVGPSRPTLH